MVDFTEGNRPKPENAKVLSAIELLESQGYRVLGAEVDEQAYVKVERPMVGQPMQFCPLGGDTWANGKVIAYHRGLAWVESQDDDRIPILRVSQVKFRVKDSTFVYIPQTSVNRM